MFSAKLKTPRPTGKSRSIRIQSEGLQPDNSPKRFFRQSDGSSANAGEPFFVRYIKALLEEWRNGIRDGKRSGAA